MRRDKSSEKPVTGDPKPRSLGMTTRAFATPRRTAAAAAIVLLFFGGFRARGHERGPVPGAAIVALDHPERVVRGARGGFASGFLLAAPGRFRPEAGFALKTAGGRSLPVCAVVTGLHRDGSVRALQLHAWLPAELATRAARFEVETGGAPAPVERVVVRDGDSLVTVECGGARFEFSRREGDFLPRIELRSGTVKDPSRPATFGGRFLGSTLAPEGPFGVAVVAADPIRAVIEVRAELGVGGDEVAAHGVARFTFRAGIPGAEILLRASAARSGRFADLSLSLPLRTTSPRDGCTIRFLPGTGANRPIAAGATAAVLALDGEGVVGTLGSGSEPLDPAARCGLAVAAPAFRGASLAVVGSRMRPLAPRSIECDASGRLAIVLLREETHLEAGDAVEFEGGIAVAAGRERATLEAALVREPLPALVGVEREALEFAAPLAPAQRDPNDPLPKFVAALDRGISALSGWRDYGDHRLSGGFANLEYDVALGFDLVALGARDARHHLVARDARRHFVLRDVSRGESGAPSGIPWRHGDDHRSHEFDPGHVFLGGLALGALIDEHPLVGSTLKEAVSGLAELTREGAALAMERDYGWSLIAFHDAEWVLGNDATAGFRRPILDALLATQAPRGFFAIDRGRDRGGFDPPLGAYVPTPWVTAGITLEALAREYVARRGAVERAEAGAFTVSVAESREGCARISAAIGRTLDHLLVDARYENGEFAARVGYDAPGSTVLARDGVADPIDRLLLAAGFGRAAWILGDRALADLFEREVAIATSRLKRLPLSANKAARGMVAWRSIVDSRARLSRP